VKRHTSRIQGRKPHRKNQSKLIDYVSSVFSKVSCRWAAKEGLALLKKTIETCEDEGGMKLFVVAAYAGRNGTLVHLQCVNYSFVIVSCGLNCLREESKHRENAKSLSKFIKFKSHCGDGLELWMETEFAQGEATTSCYRYFSSIPITLDEDAGDSGSTSSKFELELDEDGHVVLPDWINLSLQEKKELFVSVVKTEYGT
jgi:hypothetical protein